MKGKEIIVKQDGCTYVFQVDIIIKPDEMKEIRKQIQEQLAEGCVVLPAQVRFVNATPNFRMLRRAIRRQGKL